MVDINIFAIIVLYVHLNLLTYVFSLDGRVRSGKDRFFYIILH